MPARIPPKKKQEVQSPSSSGAASPKLHSSSLSTTSGKAGNQDGLTPSTKRREDSRSIGILARKFVVGLASRLTGGDERNTVAVEGAFRAAVAAIPEGKLKVELECDHAEYLRLLSTELGTIRTANSGVTSAAAAAGTGGNSEDDDGDDDDDGAEEAPSKKRKSSAVATTGKRKKANSEADTASAAVAVVPCTQRLYRHARATAESALAAGDMSGGNDGLRALALNPRAPLDLLADAMRGSAIVASDFLVPPSSGATLQAAVDEMRNLLAALAVDPQAAESSPTGTAFFADRAAVLAGAVARELAAPRRGAPATAEFMSTATEGLGLMLRVLQVAGMATAAPTGSYKAEGVSLLLPCAPEMGHESAVREGKTAAHSRTSIARLLAHYSVGTAVCCSTTSGQSKEGSRSVLKSVRAHSVGAGGEHGGDADDSSSSDSDGDGDVDVESEGEEDGCGSNAISRHLLTLCASHLAGEETATLEFLRLVGNYCYETRSRPRLAQAVAAFLAPTCARAIARLPRPSAAPAPSAALFLRRAYAFRVVESLVQLLNSTTSSLDVGGDRQHNHYASGLVAVGQKQRNRSSSSASSAAANARPWDFIGAAEAPHDLLEFLGRPEAVVAVGGAGATAMETLRELTARRHNPASVGELLRTSEACSPRKLGPLLEVVENLIGGMGETARGFSRTAGGSDAVSGALEGFFVDTIGSGEAGAPN